MTYEVHTDIPVPDNASLKGGAKPKFEYPFDTLRIGYSFLVPIELKDGDTLKTARKRVRVRLDTAIKRYVRKHKVDDRAFTVRLLTNSEGEAVLNSIGQQQFGVWAIQPKELS